MSVLLQISDPHFGTEVPQVVEALVALAARQRPDLVVLSGDITQRARPAQFRAAKEFVSRLGASHLVIPGNHDISLFNLWERLARPYAHYAESFGEDLAPVHSSQNLLVMGVNTTRAWRHKNGELSAAQIASVAERLGAATPQQLRVVVVHQPVAITKPEDETNLLRGHANATRAWAQAGADVVMGGHIHLPFTKALPGLARRLWAVQAGTAVSARIRSGAPNSVNILRWAEAPALAMHAAQPSAHAGPVCLVERWDFSDAARAFVLNTVTPVEPERS